MSYKVWVIIEELDDEREAVGDVGEPVDVAEFDSLEEAQDFVASIEED